MIRSNNDGYNPDNNKVDRYMSSISRKMKVLLTTSYMNLVFSLSNPSLSVYAYLEAISLHGIVSQHDRAVTLRTVCTVLPSLLITIL